MDELWHLTASDLAASIEKREVSSREVVQALLDRIDAVNGAVNAITVVLADEALAAADRTDAALAKGETAGPLHGVPFSVKENIDVAGSATTQGVVALKDVNAPLDAPHVERLKAAGAIPLARTNLPDFGMRWHTDNALRGATRNPWNASVTPGGSSGGEAAALALGMTPLGLGNDYGGSLRVPSAFCGTTAIRPTLGRVAAAGSMEPQDGGITIQLMAVQGPMARSVADLRVSLEIISGEHPRDPWSSPVPLVGPQVDRPIRVAVVRDGLHPDVADAVSRAAEALADAGYAVEDTSPPRLAEAAELWASLVMTEMAVFWPMMEPFVSEDAKRAMSFVLTPPKDLAGFIVDLTRRQGIAREWAVHQQQCPLVLGAVSTQPPFEVGRDVSNATGAGEVLRSMALTVVANLLGLPAAAVPTGVANGLPQGVQVMGPRYREDLCLDAAQAIEDRLGVITPIDPS